MIDKNLPKEYQHITDYRKIPSIKSSLSVDNSTFLAFFAHYNHLHY